MEATIARRIVFVTLLFLTVLGLTSVGQYRLDPDGYLAEPGAHLYRAVQLFGLEGDWTHELERVPAEIQVARFVAPLVTLASLVLVFARGAWVTLVNVRARFARDHIVLVGLNALGWHFAASCRRLGLRAVAIELDGGNPNVDLCRQLGVPVIIGDAMLPATLKRAGLAGAAHLVTFIRDDGTNVEITLLAKSLIRDSGVGRANPLRVSCHLANAQLARRLEQYPKFFLDPQLAVVSFFNVHGLAARTLLLQHPPEVYADVMRRRDVHVVLIGATALAEQVMLQILRMAHYANLTPPRITFLNEGAASYGDAMRRMYPELHATFRIAYVEMPLQGDIVDLQGEAGPVGDAAAYMVCLEDESEALSIALAVRRATLLGRGLNAPVMVAMERSDGLARLLESELGTPEIPDGIYPFGMLDEIMSAETLVDERLDLLAQAFHENYLETALQSDEQRKPSQVPWRLLPEEYRDASRLEADHLDAKLRAVGYRETPGRTAIELTEDEVQRIARMEHNRFVAVRLAAGWHPGRVRSDVAHIDDRLTGWQETDAAGLSYDLNAARQIPGILSRRLGYGLRPEIVIGVTGHRLDRLGAPTAAMQRAIAQTLDEVAQRYPDAVFVVLSSLAEGADRLVAAQAMQRLDARLRVALPLPYDIYVEDFGRSDALDRNASLAEFHALLGRAEHYFEMPLEFGSILDFSTSSPEGAARRAQQYALAGAYLVQRSHELVAVWDGSAPKGEGGTAQVMEWRVRGVPAPYRFADAYFPHMEQKPPLVVSVATDGSA